MFSPPCSVWSSMSEQQWRLQSLVSALTWRRLQVFLSHRLLLDSWQQAVHVQLHCQPGDSPQLHSCYSCLYDFMGPIITEMRITFMRRRSCYSVIKLSNGGVAKVIMMAVINAHRDFPMRQRPWISHGRVLAWIESNQSAWHLAFPLKAIRAACALLSRSGANKPHTAEETQKLAHRQTSV